MHKGLEYIFHKIVYLSSIRIKKLFSQSYQLSEVAFMILYFWHLE